jgi:hypothetical protein
MASRTIKIACAAALLAPLAFAGSASAWDGPSENDCNAPYGAVTKHPAPNRDCVGLDLRDGDEPGAASPTNAVYAGSSIVVQGGTGGVGCNPGDLLLGIRWESPTDSGFVSTNTLETTPNMDVTPDDGVPNAVSGTGFGAYDGYLVSAICRDVA